MAGGWQQTESVRSAFSGLCWSLSMPAQRRPHGSQESSTPALHFTGHRCNRHTRQQKPHHWDLQPAAPQLPTAAQGRKGTALSQEFDPVIDLMLRRSAGNN